MRVKNVSKANIVINNKTLRFEESIKITEDDLEKLENLIDSGMVELIIDNSGKKTAMFSETEFKEIINETIEVLYKFHINDKLTNVELKKLILFYNNISKVLQLSNETESLIDEIDNQESLVEILINNIYPTIIKSFYDR